MNMSIVSGLKSVQWRYIVGAGLLAVSAQALADKKIDQTLDTVATPYIEVEHMNGKANFVVWDKNAVRVEGTLGDDTDEFTFKERDGEVKIEVEVRRQKSSWGNWSKSDGDNLTIYVPVASNINYTAINADVVLQDITGSVEVEVVNGDVDIHNTTGKLSLEAVNGDITFKKVTGELVVETVNGDIRGDHKEARDVRLESVNGNIDVKTNSPEVNVESVNGNIDLVLDRIVELDINTVNGRAEVAMILDKKGDVRASSVGGTIDLTFQKGVSARFDIEAHAGGRIINDITDDKMQKAKYGPRRWLEFSSNGGGARVEVSTVSGRVKLATN